MDTDLRNVTYGHVIAHNDVMAVNCTERRVFTPDANFTAVGHDNCRSTVLSSNTHTGAIVESIYALDTYVTPAVCAIGCLGNCLNLAVLTRTRFRQTDGNAESGAHLGLILLAISDLIYCLVLFPRALLPTTHSLFANKGFRFLYQMYGDGLITTLSLTSTWIVVVMAIMRYFCICHPFFSRKWDSAGCARFVYPVTCALCVLLNVPAFLRYKEDTVAIDDRFMYLVDINDSLDYKTRAGKAVIWLKAVVRVYIPAVCLVFCNFSLIRALQQSRRMRIQSHVQENLRGRRLITVTLIAIAIFFIVLVFPSETMDFFLNFIRRDVTRTEMFLLARSIANILQVINFSFNFILYCVINVHFRSVLFDMCGLSQHCQHSMESPHYRPSRSGQRPGVTRMSSFPTYTSDVILLRSAGASFKTSIEEKVETFDTTAMVTQP